MVQATLAATMSTLAATEDWSDPELKSFKVFTRKPEHLGLAEVRFKVIEKSKKRQFRVIGLWRQEEREFICLMGFEKKGRSPYPTDAFEIAMRLRILLEEGKGFIYEHI